MRDPLPFELRRRIRRLRAANPIARARARRSLPRLPPGLARKLPGGGGRHVLLVSLTEDVEQAKLEALLAKALQAHGGRVTVYVFRSSRRSVELFRALGVDELAFYEDVAPPRGDAAAEAERIVAGCTTVHDYKELTYRGARVGRQALSTVVRARHDAAVDVESDQLRREITAAVAVGIEGVHASERLLDGIRPDVLLMVERGYAGLGALSDVALERDVPVVQFGSAHRDDAFFLKRYTRRNRDLQQRSLDEQTWSELLAEGWSDEKDDELRAELDARETGKWFLARRVRHARRRRDPAELRRELGLDDRKVAVLFSHVLWDASMFFGRDLYPDQAAWFVETVRLAAADDRVQWLVKLHPALFWKLRAEGVETEPAEVALLRERIGELPPHVKLLDPAADVANTDLFQLLDAGVTIRGTVGIELPQLGVPVLTAGTSDYAGRGFTVDAETIEDYERNVRGIAELERLSPEQVELAKLYAYGVFCRRPWRFSSFRIEYLPPSDERGVPHLVHLEVADEQQLRAAEDLRAFADWVLRSDDADFTRPAARAWTATRS